MNPYDTLGVRANASDEEIAKVYKSLAKKYHPDLNPGNEAAARRMGEINQAYDQIKTMRQNGTAWQDVHTDPYGNPYNSNPYGAYQDPFSAFYEAARSYTYYYQKPKAHPMGMILAVLVTILLVRFLLSLLFGGYGYYYAVPGAYDHPESHYSYSMPGYSYEQPMP